MAADDLTGSGGCLCGGVRYEVRGPLRGVILCHCARCRRAHGHVAAYTRAAWTSVRMTATDTLRWYSVENRELGFCGRCGSSLLWQERGADEVSIAAGGLDPPTGLETIAQIYTDSRGDYYELSGEGVRHAGSQSDPL